MADHLPRLPTVVDSEVNDGEEHFERHVFSITEERINEQRIRECQESDPATSFALEQLEVGRVILQGRFKHQRGMHLNRVVLYRGHKLVVPNSLRRGILTMVTMPHTLV